MAPIFDAVIYCHKLGLIHRDLKLENLLYSHSKQQQAVVKISDFGLSRLLGKNGLATSIVGTPGYCAPEIIH